MCGSTKHCILNVPNGQVSFSCYGPMTVGLQYLCHTSASTKTAHWSIRIEPFNWRSLVRAWQCTSSTLFCWQWLERNYVNAVAQSKDGFVVISKWMIPVSIVLVALLFASILHGRLIWLILRANLVSKCFPIKTVSRAPISFVYIFKDYT